MGEGTGVPAAALALEQRRPPRGTTNAKGAGLSWAAAQVGSSRENLRYTNKQIIVQGVAAHKAASSKHPIPTQWNKELYKLNVLEQTPCLRSTVLTPIST